MKTSILSLIILIVTGFVQVVAQSNNPFKRNLNSISIQWDKPLYNSDDIKVAFLSSILYLNGNFMVNDRFAIVASIPISHFDGSLKFDGDRENLDSDTMAGNLYLGGELSIYGKQGQPLNSLHFGVYLPFKKNNNTAFIPAVTGEVDRISGFREDVVGIKTSYSLNYKNSEGNIGFTFSPGLIYNIYTGEFAEFTDNDLDATYHAAFTRFSSSVNIHAGIRGSHLVDGHIEDIIDSGITQGYLSLSKEFGNITPEIFARRFLTSSITKDSDLLFNIGFSLLFKL